MADNLLVQFDDSLLKRFLVEAPKALKPGAARAINDTLRASRVEFGKLVSRKYRIKATEARTLGKIRRANRNQTIVEGSISFRSRVLNLSRFQLKDNKAGPRFKVKKAGPIKQLKNSFTLGKGINGIFQRQGGRIRIRKTTSIASLVNSNRVEFRNFIMKRLETNINRELQFRLEKAASR